MTRRRDRVVLPQCVIAAPWLAAALLFAGAPRFARAAAATGPEEPAQAAATASEQDREQEVHVATKTAKTQRETPGVVGVVTAEQIERQGWTSLDDVLYHQPGFAPAQDYDRRTVGARGLFEGWNNNHLLHLVDGVPWNDNLYGSAYTW